MSELDGGMVRVTKQRGMGPGVVTERKAGGRHGRARSQSRRGAMVIFFKEIAVPKGEWI
jgi:hypothetical protein